MASFTGTKTEKICPACSQGFLHRYPQDLPEILRCGRCGEPQEPKAAKPAITRKA